MIRRPVLGVLAATVLGACAPARLALPSPLDAAPRWPVAGRQGDQRTPTLRVGPWLVTDVRRSWVRGSGVGLTGGPVGLDLDRASQSYAFTVRHADGAAWRGACAVTYRHDGLVLPAGTLATEEQQRLTCELTPATATPWRLSVTQRFDRAPDGVVVHGRDTLRVRGLDRFAGAVPTRGLLAGWLLEREQRPVAAVEVVNGGAVWMHGPSTPVDAAPVMAAVAALLLHDDLRQALAQGPGM